MEEKKVKYGLTQQEVEQRIAEGKVNGEQNIKTKSVSRIFTENIFNFYNFLLVILAIILAAVSEPGFVAFANFGFMLMAVINSGIGIIQEIKAKNTIDKLSLLSAPKVIVIRDNIKREIQIKDIVEDDVMILTAGSQVCADAKIIYGSVEVNESNITGEPDPIIKNVNASVLSGSYVISGRAFAKVEHVGQDNYVTKISQGAKYYKKPNSEIWRSLMTIVKIMAGIIIPVGIALFCVKYFVQHLEVKSTIISVVGQLIGMIPSGLIALSSSVFCISVIRLAKKKTLAQDLYCIETLARVDVLCLDKTGTITEGLMEVHDVLLIGQYDLDQTKQILKNLLASIKDNNATTQALSDYTKGIEVTQRSGIIVPFSSQRKYSGAEFARKTYFIGAYEFLFKKQNLAVTRTLEKYTKDGYRTIVLASSDSPIRSASYPDLKLEAIIIIADKIRKEAPETLKFFKEEGVEIKIISGDNPVTVSSVAHRAGVFNYDKYIDMSMVGDAEIENIVDKYTIFGRVLPDQKLKLIQALKKKGHTVAMTGDGVNDVLALKEADCSIAMASGSDAAKNVSSIVLLDSNFSSLPKIVAEGRRSINNLERSASLYLMKTVYNIFIAIIFLLVQDQLPFEPRHLTLIGAVTIGLPSVIVALEPNKNRVTGRFLPKVFKMAIPGGITVAIGLLLVIFTQRLILKDLDTSQLRTMYLVVTTFIGFMGLIRICLPITFLHGLTITTMIGAFIACYLVPTPNDFLKVYLGLNNNFTTGMIVAIVFIIVLCIPIYIGFCMLFELIKKKRHDKVEAFFLRLDNRTKLAYEKNNKIKSLGSKKTTSHK